MKFYNINVIAHSTKILILVMVFSVPYQADSTTVTQAHASLSSGHYLRGLELANHGFATSLSVDINADNGLFASAHCYVASGSIFQSFDRGCISNAGLFKQVNHHNALSIEASRYDYQTAYPIDWDTNEVTISWHYQRSLRTSLSYSDDWLGRGSSTSFDISYRHNISQALNVKLESGVLWPSRASAFDSFRNASVAIEYESKRWRTSLKANTIDIRIQDSLPIDVGRTNIQWAVSYQFY